MLQNVVLVACLLSTDNVNSCMIVNLTYFGLESETECASEYLLKQVEMSHIPFQTPLQSRLSLLSFFILEAMNNILDINYCSCITRKPI